MSPDLEKSEKVLTAARYLLYTLEWYVHHDAYDDRYDDTSVAIEFIQKARQGLDITFSIQHIPLELASEIELLNMALRELITAFGLMQDNRKKQAAPHLFYAEHYLTVVRSRWKELK